MWLEAVEFDATLSSSASSSETLTTEKWFCSAGAIQVLLCA